VSLLGDVLVVFVVVTFFYFTLINSIYLSVTALAWRPITAEAHARRYLGLAEIFASPLTPAISVVVPAFNEETVIVESVNSLLALRYPHHEVIVVSDGSTDETIEVLRDEFDLVPVRWALRDTIGSAPVRAAYVSRRNDNLVVIDKENGGRADTLNAGIRAARHSYLCIIDADSLLGRDSLLELAKPLLDQPTFVAAAGGTIRIANECRVEHGQVVQVRLPNRALPLFQVLEYLRAFLVGRVGWASINALAIISGAFGLFHREHLERIGGYSTSTVGEDFELTIRLHGHLRECGDPYRLAFVADPVCWTEVPDSVAILGRQRRRWQRGTWETLYRHRRMILNPRYGVVGLLALPTAVLEFLSPVFWIIGTSVTVALWALGLVPALFAIGTLVVSFGLSVTLTIGAIAVDDLSHHTYRGHGDTLRLLRYAFAEVFGYRQLNAYWGGRGYIDIVRGTTSWGAQERRGFAKAP
jgi:cellulose synthase/poly-beta-1,6-N-acetylglucosamine synthase-like glycosyltransferase